MTDTEKSFDELDAKIQVMLERLGPIIGGDTNTIQVKARLDAFVEVVLDKLGDDGTMASELELGYAKAVHGYLTNITEQVESQLRRMALQADVAEQAGKLTVVR